MPIESPCVLSYSSSTDPIVVSVTYIPRNIDEVDVSGQWAQYIEWWERPASCWNTNAWSRMSIMFNSQSVKVKVVISVTEGVRQVVIAKVINTLLAAIRPVTSKPRLAIQIFGISNLRNIALSEYEQLSLPSLSCQSGSQWNNCHFCTNCFIVETCSITLFHYSFVQVLLYIGRCNNNPGIVEYCFESQAAQ